jgi:hypothetical protein
MPDHRRSYAVLALAAMVLICASTAVMAAMRSPPSVLSAVQFLMPPAPRAEIQPIQYGGGGRYEGPRPPGGGSAPGCFSPGWHGPTGYPCPHTPTGPPKSQHYPSVGWQFWPTGHPSWSPGGRPPPIPLQWVVAGAVIGLLALGLRRARRRSQHQPPPSVQVALRADAGHVRIIRRTASRPPANPGPSPRQWGYRGDPGNNGTRTAIADINLKPVLLGDSPSATVSASADAASAVARRSLEDTPVDWQSLTIEIGDKIEDMFDIPLVDVMIDAWRDLRELKDCADPDTHPPDACMTLALGNLDLEVSFEPHLDIIISGSRAARIDFEISADIELEAIELEIKDACIRSLRIGSCEASAKVKCAGVVVFERSWRRLAQPGEIRLPHDVPIDPWRARRT